MEPNRPSQKPPSIDVGNQSKIKTKTPGFTASRHSASLRDFHSMRKRDGPVAKITSV